MKLLDFDTVENKLIEFKERYPQLTVPVSIIIENFLCIQFYYNQMYCNFDAAYIYSQITREYDIVFNVIDDYIKNLVDLCTYTKIDPSSPTNIQLEIIHSQIEIIRISLIETEIMFNDVDDEVIQFINNLMNVLNRLSDPARYSIRWKNIII